MSGAAESVMPDKRLKTISGHLSRLFALPNESTAKTILVAVALCLVCSVVVSVAAVYLKPKQLANKALDRKQNILEVAGLLTGGKTIDELFNKIEPKVIDLATGEYVQDINPSDYDERRAAKDPARNVEIPREQDLANIGSRAQHAVVYLVKDGGATEKVILPVHGYGLWSTMYGFIALEKDGNTVYGLKFYEHAETPGLGGEVDNPKWRGQWQGKKIFGDTGDVQIRVIKGQVDQAAPAAAYSVDGLSGATLTTRGVENLLRYWLSEQGFGPYLRKFGQQNG